MVTDAGDGPVIIRHQGKDYFVPLHPELNQFAKTLLNPRGQPEPLLDSASLTTSITVVRNEEVQLINQEVIRQLMSLQGNNPVTLSTAATAFPNARFRTDGPTLKEIGEIRLADGTALGDCFFMRNGALALTQSPPFREFLRQNAPSIVQLLTNDLDHPNPVCHTTEAYRVSECQPDKLPATYAQLMAHAGTLVVDFSDNGLPEEMKPRAEFVRARLREAFDRQELSGVVFEGDRVVKIDVSRTESVRGVLAFLMAEVDGGGTAIASLATFDRARAGLMAKGTTYAAFDFHDVATVRAGYEIRASTNDYRFSWALVEKSSTIIGMRARQDSNLRPSA